MLDGWTDESTTATLAAMADVGGYGDRDHDGWRTLVASAGHHVFGIDVDLVALPASSPDELAAALSDDRQRALATNFLVLVPYADTTVEEHEVDRVDAYAAAMGTTPDTLADLHKVRQGHIKRLMLDYFRRAGTGVKMKGDDRGLIRRTYDEIHQYMGDPKITERYLPLANYDSGTLGREFFDFYRSRGFSLPGEKHSLGEEVVSHDCTHILSGFNTDGTGEINVAGFEAGMKKNDFGFELLMEVILDFQLGIDFGVQFVGYKSKVGEMDPDQMMLGIHRGLGCNVDTMGPEWDFWAVADRQVADLRAEYDITGVEGVTLAAPDHPATSD
jgi:hypothetical protein